MPSASIATPASRRALGHHLAHARRPAGPAVEQQRRAALREHAVQHAPEGVGRDRARDPARASAWARRRPSCRSAGASARARAASRRSARARAGSRRPRARRAIVRAHEGAAAHRRLDHARARERFVGERHGVAVHAAGSSARSRIGGSRAPAASCSASISRRICVRDLPVDRQPLGPGLALQRDAHDRGRLSGGQSHVNAELTRKFSPCPDDMP